MGTWYRVFGSKETEPVPAALLEHLQGSQAGLTCRFSADSEGWFKAELTYSPEAPPLVLERFLASEEGIRAELNNWAAWIETSEDNPHRDRLMQQMIATVQVFTLHGPDDDERVEKLCLAVCRFLARATDGVFQVDGRGFFGGDEALLLKEL
jgi:hypothetical protein